MASRLDRPGAKKPPTVDSTPQDRSDSVSETLPGRRSNRPYRLRRDEMSTTTRFVAGFAACAAAMVPALAQAH